MSGTQRRRGLAGDRRQLRRAAAGRGPAAAGGRARAAPEPFDPTIDEVDEHVEPADRFVPPPRRPRPRLELPRHLPWLGVFGIPALLLVSLLGGIHLPTWLGYLLVVAASSGASSTSCSP